MPILLTIKNESVTLFKPQDILAYVEQLMGCDTRRYIETLIDEIEELKEEIKDVSECSNKSTHE